MPEADRATVKEPLRVSILRRACHHIALAGAGCGCADRPR
jgi:hypothetical protein